MGTTNCPACIMVIRIPKGIKVHDLINCPHCSSLLEFISLHPPKLDWAEDPLVYPSRRFMK